ncbi:MAG: RNA 3'-terminal phosphate cyclase, partial [Planctomycetes bacterium]|nr:RNA 3'-terminal phosphate cyclase [Planctomycetota bacterium]
GCNVEMKLIKHGFYPAGGGRIEASIEPGEKLSPVDILERGEVREVRARSLLSRLPGHICGRQLEVVGRRLHIGHEFCKTEMVKGSDGPGNAVIVEVESEKITEVFTSFGDKNIKAETVAQRVCDEVLNYLTAKVPAGAHLADQLLIPLAMAGGGAFRTVEPSLHTETNAWVIEKFIGAKTLMKRAGNEAWEIRVGAPS